jgi:hypothetical protein
VQSRSGKVHNSEPQKAEISDAMMMAHGLGYSEFYGFQCSSTERNGENGLLKSLSSLPFCNICLNRLFFIIPEEGSSVVQARYRGSGGILMVWRLYAATC